jgi:hypothetical protein
MYGQNKSKAAGSNGYVGVEELRWLYNYLSSKWEKLTTYRENWNWFTTNYWLIVGRDRVTTVMIELMFMEMRLPQLFQHNFA